MRGLVQADGSVRIGITQVMTTRVD
jgi:hypothetical protein